MRCRLTNEEPVMIPDAVPILMAHALMVQQPVVKPLEAALRT
jgi:hypothetical protein